MVSNAVPPPAQDASAAGESLLQAQLSGGGGPDVLLLHGLFGAGSNLGAMARALAGAGYRVHQLDLPGHGRSPWLATLSLRSMAAALQRYLDAAVPAPATLVGHSLGGKVAMQLAFDAPQRVNALVLADIAPVAYPESHQAVFAAIEAVAAAAPRTRRAAADIMRRHLEEEGVVQFLSLGLARDDGGTWRWRFDARGLQRDYRALLAAPTGEVYGGPVLLLRGARSRYVDDAALAVAALHFPRLETVTIDNAGHWLHAEQPDAVNGALLRFLQGVVPCARAGAVS